MGEGFGLKRVLGLGDLVAIEVGTTVGAGIFSLTALAASFTGPTVPLAFIAAAVPIVFIMMTVGMLGAAMPTLGGTYRYPSRLFSPMWAVLGVWGYALGLVLGALPMYATECVHYLQALVPWLPGRLSAVAILTIFYLVNLRGISIAASVQAVMVLVLVAALVFFGAAGISEIDPANFMTGFSGGPGGFILAACVLTFALQGSNSVIELGAEIKRPATNIPRSLLISITLVTLLYVLVSASAVGTVDMEDWISGEHPTLAYPAAEFLSRPGFLFFMVGGALFAFTTTLNGTFMWATKSLMVVAKDGLVPRRLAQVSRHGTPALFLTTLWGLAVIGILMGAGIEIFASYATIGGMIIFIPSMIAAMLLPKRAPELYNCPGYRLRGKMLYIAPLVGIAASVLLLLVLIAELKLWALPFAIWLLGGYFFFRSRKKRMETEEGMSFSELIERDFNQMVKECMAAIKEE